MAGSEKEYRMAVALLDFKRSFSNLAAASKALPDLDVSDLYPFYLLDYEQIAPAVSQWCMHHASKLFEQLPDIVANPACFNCPHIGAELAPNGQCPYAAERGCYVFPKIMYSRQQCAPALVAAGYQLAGLSDGEVELLYLQEVEKRGKNSKQKDQAP